MGDVRIRVHDESDTTVVLVGVIDGLELWREVTHRDRAGFFSGRETLGEGWRELIVIDSAAAALPGGVGPDGRPHLGSATGANE